MSKKYIKKQLERLKDQELKKYISGLMNKLIKPVN